MPVHCTEGPATDCCRHGRGATIRRCGAHLSGTRANPEDDGALPEWLEDERTRAAGECTPPMDVVETAAGLEVLLDLPGVPPRR